MHDEWIPTLYPKGCESNMASDVLYVQKGFPCKVKEAPVRSCFKGVDLQQRALSRSGHPYVNDPMILASFFLFVTSISSPMNLAHSISCFPTVMATETVDMMMFVAIVRETFVVSK